MKELLPIMQAWAEGRIIQFRKKGTVEWVDLYEDDLRVSSAYHYRIKPEPKYRPFKTQEECWHEMHKHPDFGWVAAQDSKVIYHINIVGDGYIHIDGSSVVFSTAYSEYECDSQTDLDHILLQSQQLPACLRLPQ